jgi:glycosyltransferase involved in cell wall biosynthesis
MPKMNSLPRLSRNLFGYARYTHHFLGWDRRSDLENAVRARFDHVHFNHEALHPLATWLRPRHGKSQTIHIRTMIPDNIFGRWQCRRMAAANNRLIFITENERDNFSRLSGADANGEVIYNIAEIAPHPEIVSDGRLKIALLSNFSWQRGCDRVVEIAEMLAARGRRDFLFVVAGDMQLKGKMPGDLGHMSRAGRTLADYAIKRGVLDMIQFLGHVTNPEAVLSACDILIKPTREYNPWGRDILEGLAAGKPVISIGRYDRFVTPGKTGYLLPEYDPESISDILVNLEADRSIAVHLGEAARERISKLCDGKQRAADLLGVWQSAAHAGAAQ